jgi:hypothetical protein
MSNQLVVRQNGGALAAFGDRDAIREMTERLKATMPGGRKLDDVEARSLAQLSLAHDLDPFNGEFWMIPSSGLMVGIKGLRKAARRAAREEGGTYWTEFRRVEPKERGASANAVVYECHLRDTITVQAWAQSIHQMTGAGVPYPDAVAALGPAPVVIGVGIATPDERSRMEIQARARKRAEADAIKQRYDIAFGNARFSDEEPETEIVDAVAVDATPEPRSEAQILNELGYDAEPGSEPQYEPSAEQPARTNGNSRPYSPETLQARLQEIAGSYTGRSASQKQRGLVASLIEQVFAGPDATLARKAVLWFLFDVESLNDLQDEMILGMLNNWLKPTKDSGGAYVADPMAAKELKAVYAEALRAQGQMPLPMGDEPAEEPDIPF